MASVFTMGGSNIEYNITDGEVREFTLCGKLLYDKAKGIEEPGWQQLLTELVKSAGLDQESKRYGGYRAFVYWMREQGLLDEP